MPDFRSGSPAYSIIVLSFALVFLLGTVASQSPDGGEGLSANLNLTSGVQAFEGTWFDLQDQKKNDGSTLIGMHNVSLNTDNITMLQPPQKASSRYEVVNATSGKVVVGNDSTMIKVSNLTRGRYVVNDTVNASVLTNVTVDILNHTSNITGRVIDTSPSPGGPNLQSGDVKFYHWLNLTEFTPTGVDAKNDPFAGSSTDVFYANITGATASTDYWIGINTKGYVREYQPGHSIYMRDNGFPRINDFVLSRQDQGSMAAKTVNLSVKVMNESSPATDSLENVSVRIRQMDRTKHSSKRIPYMRKPPVLENMSGPSGWVNFSYLPKAGYYVDILNGSLVRTQATAFAGDDFRNLTTGETVDMMQPGAEYYLKLNATYEEGNVSVKMEGPAAARYGMIVREANLSNRNASEYLVNGIAAGQAFNVTVPDGVYTLMAAKMTGFNSGFPTIQTATKTGVEVVAGKTKNSVTFEFPDLKTISGTVDDGSTGVQGARLQFENESQGKFHGARTDSNGDYSLSVSADTLYSVEVVPPDNSGLKVNTTVINASRTSAQDFTLASGATFMGYVQTKSGNSVDGFVRVFNTTERVYRRARINGSGYFKVGGLDPQQGYRVGVETFRSDISDLTTKLDPHGSPANWTNASGINSTTFNLGSSTSRLDGYVKDSNGNPVTATVKVRGERVGVLKETQTSSSGYYSISGLPENVFYGIRVSPKNDSISPVRDSTYLTGNETMNFTVGTSTTLSGDVVQKGGGTITSTKVDIYAWNSRKGIFKSTESNSDGSYSLDLRPGKYTVYIWPGGGGYKFNRTSIRLSQGSNSEDLVLESGTTVSGSITKNGQSTNFEGWIGFWNESKDSFSWKKYSGGSYTVKGLSSVAHNVYISVRGTDLGPKRVVVKESAISSGSKNFDFQSLNGQNLTLIVRNNTLDSTGTKMRVPNATVVTGSETYKTNTSGMIGLGQQRANSNVDVVVRKDGYQTASKSISISERGASTMSGTVPDVKKKNITLSEIQTKLKVTVNVTNTTGSKGLSGVGGVTVAFVKNDASSPHSAVGTTGGSGLVDLKNLVPGDYGVSMAVNASESGTFREVIKNLDQNSKGTLNMSSAQYNLTYDAVVQP